MYKRLAIFIISILVIIALWGCKQSVGNPEDFEDKYNVEGESEHWKASLEYEFRENNKMWAGGYVKYIGDDSPEKIDMKFVIYDIEPTSYYNKNIKADSRVVESNGETVRGAEIKISVAFDRSHKPEVYEEAINHGYIEIKWMEQGKEEIEKINIEIVE